MPYTPTVWSTGDVITASLANKWEQGISNATDIAEAAETPAGAQAKADQAEQAAKDWVKVRGIGSSSATVADANTLSEGGLYYVDGNTLNVPIQFGYLYHANNAGGGAGQIFIHQNNGRTFVRGKSQDVWSDWNEIITSAGGAMDEGATLDIPDANNVQHRFEGANNNIPGLVLRCLQNPQNGENIFSVRSSGNAPRFSVAHGAPHLSSDENGWYISNIQILPSRFNNGAYEVFDGGTWKVVGGVKQIIHGISFVSNDGDPHNSATTSYDGGKAVLNINYSASGNTDGQIRAELANQTDGNIVGGVTLYNTTGISQAHVTWEIIEYY